MIQSVTHSLSVFHLIILLSSTLTCSHSYAWQSTQNLSVACLGHLNAPEVTENCGRILEAGLGFKGNVLDDFEWHAAFDLSPRSVWQQPMLMPQQSNAAQTQHQFNTFASMIWKSQQLWSLQVGRFNSDLRWWQNSQMVLSHRYWLYGGDQLMAILKLRLLEDRILLWTQLGKGHDQWHFAQWRGDTVNHAGGGLDLELMEGVRLQYSLLADRNLPQACLLCPLGLHQDSQEEAEQTVVRQSARLFWDGSRRPWRGLTASLALQNTSPMAAHADHLAAAQRSTVVLDLNWKVLATYYLAANYEQLRLSAASPGVLPACTRVDARQRCSEGQWNAEQINWSGFAVAFGMRTFRATNIDLALRRDWSDSYGADSLMTSDEPVLWSFVLRIGMRFDQKSFKK